MSRMSGTDVLEELWSPIAALTAAHGGRANGLITSTAVTASLIPEAPRISVVLARASLTHELVLGSGAFAVHLLPADAVAPSMEIFRRLGFRSGRDEDKLVGIPWHAGETGAPILEDARAYVEARVAATLDAGDATLVLADVVAGRELREGASLRIEDVRRHLTEADWALWDDRRTDELRRGRELRATRP